MRGVLKTVFLAWILLTPALWADEVSDRAVIEAIQSEYKANLAALNDHGTFKLAYYDGMVEDIRDITEQNLASRPRKRYSEGHGTYVYSGNKRLCEHGYSVEQLRKNSTKNSYLISGSRWFTNGSIVLLDNLGLTADRQQLQHGGSMRSTTHGMRDNGTLETPLELGHEFNQTGFEATLNEYLTSKIGWPLKSRWMLLELDQNAMLNATQVTKLVLTSMEDGILWRCWIDRARGAIPLRIHVTGKAETFEWAQENLDIRNPGNHGWIPFHWLKFVPYEPWEPWGSQALRPVGIRFWEGEVESADLDAVPDDSEFSLDFPVAISIRDSDSGLTYPASTHWDLKSISPEATAAALKLPINQKQEQSHSPPTRWFPWLPEREWWQNGLLALAGGLFFLYGGYAYRKLQRSTSDHQVSETP